MCSTDVNSSLDMVYERITVYLKHLLSLLKNVVILIINNNIYDNMTILFCCTYTYLISYYGVWYKIPCTVMLLPTYCIQEGHILFIVVIMIFNYDLWSCVA